MSIIDKNGRLFGKINIIDLFVILIVLFVIPMFIFGYKAMTVRAEKQKTWVDVSMKVSRVVPELVEVIKPEDFEIGDSGRKIGVLVKIDKMIPSATLVLANDSTHFTLINDPITKDVMITLRLLCKNESGFFYYKNLPVKVGGAIIFSTGEYDITGTILKVVRNKT